MQKGAKLGSSRGTCQIFPSQTFQTLNISSLSTKAEFGQRLIYISTLGLYIDDRDRYGYTCHKPFWQRDNFVHQAPPTCVGLLSACCQWLVHTQKRVGRKIRWGNICVWGIMQQKTHLGPQQSCLILPNCGCGWKLAENANILTHGSLSPQYKRLQGKQDVFKNNSIVKSICL